MVFQSTLASNSDESNWNQVNDLAREVRSKDVTQIFKDDSGTRRVLLGRGNDGFYGLKVSPEGTDVYDASDEDLIFNSNQNVFKIASIITGTFPATSSVSTPIGGGVGSTGATTTIAHGLGYVPAFLPYVGDGSAITQTPSTTSGGTTALFTTQRYVTADATNIYLITTAIIYGGFGSSGSASAVDGKIYLLQETAN